MHYYPSTIGEFAEAVIRHKRRATTQGRQLRKIIIGEFQNRFIIDQSLSHAHMSQPTVTTFMDIPVEVSGPWGFQAVES